MQMLGNHLKIHSQKKEFHVLLLLDIQWLLDGETMLSLPMLVSFAFSLIVLLERWNHQQTLLSNLSFVSDLMI
jgi:hypothetical protein